MGALRRPPRPLGVRGVHFDHRKSSATLLNFSGTTDPSQSFANSVDPPPPFGKAHRGIYSWAIYKLTVKAFIKSTSTRFKNQ